MKKNVLIFGSIIGAILCINMIVMVTLLYHDPTFNGNDVVGWAAMIAALSLIFFGIRNYRDNQLGGYISFGTAFKMGALTALLASTIYVVVWLFYYYLFVPDFIDVYTSHVLRNCAASDLPAKTREMANLKEMYKNPLLVILLTYMEALPLGLVIALISALILKKKQISG